MALKFMVENTEGLDTAVAALYTKGEDDNFYLDVDGAVSSDEHKKKVSEFRDKNIELLKQAEKYKDLDPDKYKQAIDKIAQLDKDKNKNIPADKVEKMVNERIAQMRSEYEEKVKEKDTTLSTQSRQLETLVVDGAIRNASIANGVRPEAIEDVILRAKSVFKVEEGDAVPYDGKDVIYGKDGTRPMTAKEWVLGLKKKAGHLFEPSTGGGARRGSNYKGTDTSKMSPLQKIKAGMES